MVLLPRELRQLILSYYDRRFNQLLPFMLNYYPLVQYKAFSRRNHHAAAGVADGLNHELAAHGFVQSQLKLVHNHDTWSMIFTQDNTEVVTLPLILDVIKTTRRQESLEGMVAYVNSWLLARRHQLCIFEIWSGGNSKTEYRWAKPL